jgi:hypothetical protein
MKQRNQRKTIEEKAGIEKAKTSGSKPTQRHLAKQRKSGHQLWRKGMKLMKWRKYGNATKAAALSGEEMEIGGGASSKHSKKPAKKMAI